MYLPTNNIDNNVTASGSGSISPDFCNVALKFEFVAVT